MPEHSKASWPKCTVGLSPWRSSWFENQSSIVFLYGGRDSSLMLVVTWFIACIQTALETYFRVCNESSPLHAWQGQNINLKCCYMPYWLLGTKIFLSRPPPTSMDVIPIPWLNALLNCSRVSFLLLDGWCTQKLQTIHECISPNWNQLNSTRHWQIDS